jgi:mRNA-degrading endonuclease toxin of MazEF toxin-antitoxin module
VVGGLAGAHRLRSRFPETRGGDARRRPQPQQDRDAGLCAAHVNLKWADAPGNVTLGSDLTGLRQDSVANVSQLITLDKALLTERSGKLTKAKTELLLAGIDVILGR